MSWAVETGAWRIVVAVIMSGVGADHRYMTDRTIPLAQRCRLAFLDGCREHWEADHGRPPTADELARLAEDYPGDPDEVAARYERGRRDGC